MDAMQTLQLPQCTLPFHWHSLHKLFSVGQVDVITALCLLRHPLLNLNLFDRMAFCFQNSSNHHQRVNRLNMTKILKGRCNRPSPSYVYSVLKASSLLATGFLRRIGSAVQSLVCVARDAPYGTIVQSIG
jgi:hypothetical protein